MCVWLVSVYFNRVMWLQGIKAAKKRGFEDSPKNLPGPLLALWGQELALGGQDLCRSCSQFYVYTVHGTS